MAVVLRILGQYDGKEFTRANADLVKLAKNGEGVSKSLASISLQSQKWSAGLMGVGKSMSTYVTLPIVGVGIAAIAVQKDFEVAMNQIGVATGAAGAEMESLSALAKKMGADTAFSSNEAAQAMLELAKGGITPAEIEAGALAATMNMAAADGMDLADAATVVTNAMNMFSLSASDANGIADALAGGANASSASIASLAEGLGNVGPAAAAVSMSLQDTTAVLAAFDQAGIKGAEGGTMLKSMLVKMIAPTAAAQKVMDRYALSFTNADGSMKSAAEVAQMMQDRMGGLDEATRGAALSQIFGTRAVLGALEMTKLGAAGLKVYTDATNEMGGAQEMADARMSGTEGAIQKLTGSLETLALSIGEEIAPAFVSIAGFIQGIVDAFSTLSPGVRKVIIVVGALAAAFGPVVIAVGAVIRAFGLVTGAMARTAAASPRVAAGMNTIKTAAGGMAGPIGLALTALTYWIISAGDAKAAAEELAATFDETSAAATEMTRAKMNADFLENFSIADLQQTPFTLNQITSAALEGGDAYMELKAQIDEYSRSLLLSEPWQIRWIGALQSSVEAQYRDAQAAKAVAEATAFAGDAAAKAAAEKRGMTSATVQSAIAAGNAVKPTAGLADALSGVSEEAETATDKLQILNGFLSQVQTMMDYQQSWLDLKKAIKDNGQTLDETTKKGLANRDALYGFAEATAKAALNQYELTGSVGTAKEALGNLGTLFKTTKMSPQARAELLAPFQALVDSLAQNGVNVSELQAMIDRLKGKDIDVNIYYHSYGKPEGVPSTEWWGYAHGGLVTGPGGPRSDSVPMMLSNREFVMQAAAVRRFGVGFMEAINRGVNPVSDISIVTTSGGGGGGFNINGDIIVASAPGERAEETVPRALRRAAFLAGV